MANHILNHNLPHENIYLIFGCRKFADCLYETEFRELSEHLPRFYYIPTFSREMADNSARPFRTGYVHPIYEEICSNNSRCMEGENQPVLKPANFYLCGWKNMIDEAKQRIQALGYDRKSIHQELYG